MTNWNRTFKMDDINIDCYKATVQVWTAITDAPNPRELGSLDISVDTDNGHANIRMNMTSQQMHDLAFNLNMHAERLKELASEANVLALEAA